MCSGVIVNIKYWSTYVQIQLVIYIVACLIATNEYGTLTASARVAMQYSILEYEVDPTEKMVYVYRKTHRNSKILGKTL